MLKRETVSEIFRAQPTLETERLILRRVLKSDAEDMYDYARDSLVTEYLTWRPHPDLHYTEEYLSFLETRYAIGDFFDWAVVERESGRMIGTCGFTRFRYEDDCGEVGYVLNRSFWGKGYAPEALRAVVRFGFSQLSLERIEAKFIEGNERSFAVMRKVGMLFEGYRRSSLRVNGALRTVGMCAILRDEFPESK